MKQSEFIDLLRRRAESASIGIDRGIEDPLFRYFELLRRWNRTINLTALPLDPPTDEALDRLLVEPLVVAGHVDSSAVRWFDLGSGGGSPAIPIKLVCRKLKLTMVESRARKAAFLRELVRELDLPNSDVENVRFDSLSERQDLAGTLDLVTARAVRIDAQLVALCSFLLHEGGQLALLGFRGDSLPGFRNRSGNGGFFIRST